MLTDAHLITETFALGSPESAHQVTGGLSNDLWKVKTENGTFAVKVMRVNAEAPDFRGNVEAAFAIEQRAFQAGVPCPEPVSLPNGRCLAEVEGQLVRVHRWVDGQLPAASDWLEQAGVLTARIHSVSEPSEGPLDDEPWDVDGWASLSNHAEMPTDLARQLRIAAPDLAGLEVVTAAPGMSVVHVDSHGDLDPKNTLSVAGTLVALDWDAARAQPAVREAVSVALDWSTDPDGFRQVARAYKRASGTIIPADPWVFGGWVSALGGWLVHNATERPDSALGQAEIRLTCERLLHLNSSLPAYQRALDPAQ